MTDPGPGEIMDSAEGEILCHQRTTVKQGFFPSADPSDTFKLIESYSKGEISASPRGSRIYAP